MDTRLVDGKWYSTAELALLLGIDPSETAAAGDSLNDLSMIRAAGLASSTGLSGLNSFPSSKAGA